MSSITVDLAALLNTVDRGGDFVASRMTEIVTAGLRSARRTWLTLQPCP
jgi:hypothetical protein